MKQRRHAAEIWDFLATPHAAGFFCGAVIKMHVGEISKPVRTRLGFHIIQLTDHDPPRRMTFDEAREEIGFTLENEKRQAVLQILGVELLGRPSFPWGRAGGSEIPKLLHCLPADLNSV